MRYFPARAWTDVDFEKSIVILNLPEKRSNPRMWKISGTLIGMLNTLPKDSGKVFGDSSIHSTKSAFMKARKRLASKLQNPRLENILSYAASLESHDALSQDERSLLRQTVSGTQELQNTEIYINIERTMFAPSDDEFTVKVAENLKTPRRCLKRALNTCAKRIR